MSRDMTKPTKWLCAQRRLRSAWPSAQSDQSICCPSKTAWFLSYPLSAQRSLWPDWADAQDDLSLCWAHTHFVGFALSRLIYRYNGICLVEVGRKAMIVNRWTASSEFGTYRLCEQRRFRRACASAQSRQNLRFSLIQAVNQEEPSDRKPDPWPLWMTGHAQLKFVMTECSKTQIRLTGLRCNRIPYPAEDIKEERNTNTNDSIKYSTTQAESVNSR